VYRFIFKGLPKTAVGMVSILAEVADLLFPSSGQISWETQIYIRTLFLDSKHYERQDIALSWQI